VFFLLWNLGRNHANIHTHMHTRVPSVCSSSARTLNHKTKHNFEKVSESDLVTRRYNSLSSQIIAIIAKFTVIHVSIIISMCAYYTWIDYNER
jgi:hypothetical protein